MGWTASTPTWIKMIGSSASRSLVYTLHHFIAVSLSRAKFSRGPPVESDLTTEVVHGQSIENFSPR